MVLIYIPPKHIPDDYMLPLQGMTASKYQDSLYRQVKRGNDYEPKHTLSVAVKQLKNITAWMYGTQTNPLVAHPEINGKMLPPSYSIYLGYVSDRFKTRMEQVNSGKITIKDVADREGFKTEEEFFDGLSTYEPVDTGN